MSSHHHQQQHEHSIDSSPSDATSIIKKGLLALGITASTSLLSYLAYKYFNQQEQSTSNTSTSTTTNSTNSSGNNSGGNSKQSKIKVYKIDDESTVQDWLLFENAKLGLSFKYPSNYTAVLNNSTHLNQIQLIDNHNKESPVIILISIEENIMNFDSIEYSQQNLELLQQQSVGNIQILQQDMFQLSNGLPGIEISFDINSNNTIKAYIASISQEFKCYMVQHLVSLGSGTIHDFNIDLIRNILKTLKITKPTVYGKAILKRNGIEMLLPSLFYASKYNELSIVRYHKDDIVKEIKLLNMGNTFDKNEYIKKGKLMQTSLNICGQDCDIINYKLNDFEYLDLIFNYSNSFYILNCKCKSELFNDFKSEAILTAMNLKINDITSTTTTTNTSNDSIGMIYYENSEFNFKINVPSNQIIHQFSHQEPVVSFVTNTNELPLSTTTTTTTSIMDNTNTMNNNSNILSKLTLETMVSVQPIPSNVSNIHDVRETSLQLLEHSSIQIIDSYIHQMNNGHDCFTSTYTMNASDPSFTFMVSSLLYNNMVYSISTYTISKAFDANVEDLFKQIHQSFTFI